MMPLEGIKVIDFTQAAAGPFAGLLLGDMGADVVKVEPPGGDHFRPVLSGAWVVVLNRNKRGISLDLRTEEGKEIAKKMVAKADVMLEAFVPGVMERFGLGYEAVSKINPGIVYCSFSGYGQDGPYRERAGYDVCAQCESGLMAATGEPDRPHVRIGSSLIDYGTGIFGAYGVALALISRQKTGRGQHIDVSLIDTGINFMNYWVTFYSMTGANPPKVGSGHMFAVPYQVFDTKDRPVFMGVSTDKFWRSFCKQFNQEELVDDPRFNNQLSRISYREELVPIVADILKQYTSEEVLEKLNAEGVPCAPVNTVGEAIEDPHVKARNSVIEMEYPGSGKLKVPGIPVRLSDTPGQVRFTAPRLGEHTFEVLKEYGYSEEELKRLEENQVIKQFRE